MAPDGPRRDEPTDAVLEALRAALPEPDDEDLVEQHPTGDPPREEHRPPPETIWGAI